MSSITKWTIGYIACLAIYIFFVTCSLIYDTPQGVISMSIMMLNASFWYVYKLKELWNEKKNKPPTVPNIKNWTAGYITVFVISALYITYSLIYTFEGIYAMIFVLVSTTVVYISFLRKHLQETK